MEAEPKYDVGVVAVCGTGTQKRNPDLTLSAMTADEIADRLHPDIPNRMSIGTMDLWPGMNSSDFIASEHGTQFAKLTFEELRHKFRAIVPVFGSNTGADFGTHLALSLGPGIDFSVVIPAGQRHHEREGSDSMKNIENSVRGAKSATDHGVAEVMNYGGEGNLRFWRSATALKLSDNNLEIYSSFNTPHLGLVTGHDIFFRKIAHRVNPEITPTLHPYFTGKLLAFRMHTDFDPVFLKMVAKKCEDDEVGCDIIVLNTYETGNVPTRFLPVIEEIVGNGTQVVVVPYFSEPNLTRRIPREEQNAVQAGAITAPGNVTQPALIAKIRQLHAHPELVAKYDDFEEALNTNFVGEIPPEENIELDV